MFVSSYSTYITNNTPAKALKSDNNSRESGSKLFSQKSIDLLNKQPVLNSVVPANYISKAQVQYNKQLLNSQQDDLQKNIDKEFKATQDIKDRLSDLSTLGKAKNAYTENSVMFSLFKKPQPSLNQTVTINQEMPQELQKLQEKQIRSIMVNTYLANDNYYQITA